MSQCQPLSRDLGTHSLTQSMYSPPTRVSVGSGEACPETVGRPAVEVDGEEALEEHDQPSWCRGGWGDSEQCIAVGSWLK